MSVESSINGAVHYHRVAAPRQGPLSRGFDRIKRPLFLGFFGLTIVGGLTLFPPLFIGGTLGFALVGALHMVQRNSHLPLLGHYAGIGRFLRVTSSGRVLLTVTVISGIAAFNMSINLLYLVLGILLAAVLVSGMLSENSLRRVTVRTFLPPAVYAGEPFLQRLTVRNGKRRLPSYSLMLSTCFEDAVCEPAEGVYLLKVPADGQVTLTSDLILETRGRHRADEVRIATAFPFGLTEKWSFYPVEEETVVYPALGRLIRPIVPSTEHPRWKGSGKVLNKQGQEEFWGLREYRDGDNPRHIHWRTSARLGKRLVKEYHREQASRIAVLLDTQVSEHPTAEELHRFELAVSFCATLSVHYLRQGFEVALAAGTVAPVKVTADRSQRQLRRILGTLAEIQPAHDGGFPELVQSLDHRFLRDSYVVAVLLEAARCPYATLAMLQEHRQSVRVIDLSGRNFRAVFEPPALLARQENS